MSYRVIWEDAATGILLKNAIMAFFNSRQVRSTARKTPIFIVVLTSHPCDDAAS